jgi:SAM-dependent methyltransferase
MDEERAPSDNPPGHVVRGRRLEDETSVWTQNSWDDVEWTKVQESSAESVIAHQISSSPHLSIPDAVSQIIQEPAASRWDTFYSHHSRHFFKDRKWLPGEFPELFEPETRRILEVGCGAGNTVFPLAKIRHDEEDVFVFACDFAPNAVRLVKEFREYDERKMHVFLHDLAQDVSFEGIQDDSLDVVVAIFVLSALDPSKLPFALAKIYRVLKPGGKLLFRDYGKYDMTQLRFKPDRLIRPDLYVRGDGTAVHFFTEEEIMRLAQMTGFEVLTNLTDRRLLVNRFRKLTMYRIWVQAKLYKPR